MSDRPGQNGSPPSGFERFEFLARRLFAVDKHEVERQRADYEMRKQELQSQSAGGERPKPKLRFPANIRRFAMSLLGVETLKCSFCGKTSAEVTYLIAGGKGAVHICDACVALCVGIVDKAKASPSAQNPPQ